MANALNPARRVRQLQRANNPSGTETALNANDFYLYESYQVELAVMFLPRIGRRKPTNWRLISLPSGSKSQR